jgi:hypothetical protein
MSKPISAVLVVLWVIALVGPYAHTALAQDKAQITDVQRALGGGGCKAR